MKHIRGNFGVRDSGTVTGTSWNQAFIQSVEFDNLDGIRHNAQGNLLALDFGTAAAGGRLVTMQTRGITAGQTSPGTSAELLKFNGQNGTELGRIGGLSISPTNRRIAVSSNELGPSTAKLGKLVVLDYTAAPNGDATGAAVSNYRSIEIAGLRTGTASRTSSTTWLDANHVLVAAGDSSLASGGNLYQVTVATDGSLSQQLVAPDLFQGTNLSFTNVTYEPTVSPYVFVSGGGLVSNQTINKLIVLDPRNAFAAVTPLLDFSPDPTGGNTAGTADGSVNTLREVAFDSKGNLVMNGFAGPQALGEEYVMKTLINARDIAALTSQSPNLVGLLKKNQTSDIVTPPGGTANPTPNPIAGTSSSFNGNDVAITNVDYVNPDVNVNIRQRDLTQQYFGTSPIAQVVAKLKAGTIGSSDAPAGSSKGVGYSFTDGTGGGTFRLVYTLKGDANLTKSVDFADLLALAQNYGAAGTKVWTQGDFNYDGVVDFSDLLSLAQNYSTSLLSSSSSELVGAGLGGTALASDWALAQSLVPEPTTLALVAGAGIVGLRRRRA